MMGLEDNRVMKNEGLFFWLRNGSDDFTAAWYLL